MKKWKWVLSLFALAALCLLAFTYGGWTDRLPARPAAVILSTPTPSAEPPAQQEPVEAYRRRREAQTEEDRAALQALIAQEAVEGELRARAAARLESMIANRQAEQAIEGALTGAGLAPCLAVKENDAVSVMVGGKTLTQQQTALIISLCVTYGGVAGENVRIIPTDSL